MARTGRWDYFADERTNPKNDRCPVCEEQSKTFYVGGSTSDNVASHKWRCEFGHSWVILEDRVTKTSTVEIT